MKVNIEKAEEIIHCITTSTKKKDTFIQKQSLYEIIKQVEIKRKNIQDFILVVKLMNDLYEHKKHSHEQLIHQLVDREQLLDQDLLKLSHQQQELEKRQCQLRQALDTLRTHAETCRDKKIKHEQHYHAVASVPLLSMQSRKKYLKARDKNLEAEQQLSEMRNALEKCQDHLRLIAKTLSAQHAEQSHLYHQRRGSIETMQSTQQQLEFLQQGCEFWEAFDTYQAHVVLESATYLYELKHNTITTTTTTTTTTNGDFDIHQVWVKTFLLACFEYGDREEYGDAQWSPEKLRVDFECAQCHIPQLGWPRIMHTSSSLVCEFCYNTTTTKPCKTTTSSSKTPLLEQLPKQDSRMKKIVSHLFHHSKINPIIT